MMLPRLVLCVSVVCATIVSGYVIKKRSGDGGNRLADALKVIERERRRLKDIDDAGFYDEFYEQVPEVRNPYAELERKYEDDSFLQDLFDHIRADDQEELSEPTVVSDDEGNEVEVPAAEPPTEEKVDESELENIFDDDKSITSDEKKQEDNKKDSEKEKKEDEEKRTVPWQMGGPGGKPHDKPDKKDEDDQNEELTEEEVSKLLQDVEETEKEKLEDEEAEAEAEEEEEAAALPVSKTEIEEAINDIPEDEDTPDSELSSDEEWVDFPTEQDADGKEWLMDQYLQQPYSGAAKKKRSQDATFEPENELSAKTDDEIVAAMTECLQQFIELEDEENTKLAQALNLATLGQVEKTDKYIPDEVEYLRQAVRREQLIKQRRRCLRLGAQARGEFNDVGFPDAAEAEKRGAEAMTSQEMIEEIPEQTQEADINDMLTEKLKQYLLNRAASRQEQQTTEDDEEEDLLLNPYYRELMQRYSIQPQSKRSGDFPLQEDLEDEIIPLEEEELAAEEAEAEEEPSNEEIEGALENYIANLSPLEQEELKYEVEDALAAIPLSEAEMCPAIEIYTDNCDYALKLGLELDEEATDLCNRHQLCYTCGGAFNLGYKDCDKGYLEEADLLCGYGEECKNEAAGLYVVMARGHHYVHPSAVDDTCRQQCVLDYIVGPNGDNL